MSATTTTSPTSSSDIDVDPVRAALTALADVLSPLPAAECLDGIGRGRNMLAGIETRVLAAKIADGWDENQVERLARTGGRVTKKTSRRTAKQAAVVADNPELADRLCDDQLQTEHLDLLATANEQTNGAAANDTALIDALAATTPDQARRIASDWTRRQLREADIHAAHEQARRKRKVTKYDVDLTTSVLKVEGDRTSIDIMYQHLRHYANQQYQAQGGRDLPADQHPTTFDQRLYDACHNLITGNASPNDSCSEADGGIDSSDSNAGVPERANGSTLPTQPSRPGRPGRPVIFVSTTIENVSGCDSTPAELIGTGPISDSVLNQIGGDADLIAQIFSGDGEILWQSRKQRYATHAQQLALVSRDKGCVLCGAHPNGCDAHHLTPYNAPAKGDTDIENLASLCQPCHKHTHNNQLTLEKTEDGTWKLRPATPSEISPPRPEPD